MEKIKVREPDTFDGSDPRKLRDFLVSCNLHFQDRPNVFADDERKILFVLSFLKGAAISWFEPALMDPNNAAHWMWDFEAFISELESNFGPHDPIGDAEHLLTNLAMSENSRILKYNVEFWKLAARLDWNESALVAWYFSRLPLRLRVEVMRGGKPSTLGDLRLKAQDADDIYWMQKNETSRSSGTSAKKDKPKTSYDNSSSNSPSNTNSNNHSNNFKSNSGSKSKSNSGNNKTSDKPKVNALTDKLGRDGKLTSDERERRMKEKLCLYCGKPGHKASECNKSASAKGRVATVDSEESKK
jgi:hypothetical protein